MKRAVSVAELQKRSFKVLPFAGEWQKALGQPEIRGTWIIWGNSTNGKTTFALQLAKHLGHFGKVVYNALEEGASLSMVQALERVGMMQVNRQFRLLEGETIADLKMRLRKDRSIRFVIIDSLQYSGIDYKEYKQLRDLFPKKIFIFISHAKGKEPAGSVAEAVRYDAFVKIWVEGYKAFPQSRYGGGEPYVIWEQGAANYWIEE